MTSFHLLSVLIEGNYGVQHTCVSSVRTAWFRTPYSTTVPSSPHLESVISLLAHEVRVEKKDWVINWDFLLFTAVTAKVKPVSLQSVSLVNKTARHLLLGEAAPFSPGYLKEDVPVKCSFSTKCFIYLSERIDIFMYNLSNYK